MSEDWRKRRYAARKAAGLCRECGKPVAEGSVTFCDGHLLRNRERVRKYNGGRAWEPGKPGRPPAEVRG